MRFLEDVLLHGVPFGAAELLGPVRGQPAPFIQRGMPADHIGFGQFGFAAHFVTQIGRYFLFQKRAYFVAKGFLLVRIAQVHGCSSSKSV